MTIAITNYAARRAEREFARERDRNECQWERMGLDGDCANPKPHRRVDHVGLIPTGNHLHHIRPWSWGGRDLRDNLVVLCARHHRATHKLLGRSRRAS